MLVNSPTERNLLALLRTCRRGQLDGDVSTLERDDPAASLRGADIDKEGFAHSEFGYFGLFGVVGLDAEQSTKEEDSEVSFE